MTQHFFSRESYLYSHPAPPLLVSHQQNAKTYNGYKLGFAKLAPAPAPAPAFRSVGHQPGQGFIQTHASFVFNNLSHLALVGSLPPRWIFAMVKVSPIQFLKGFKNRINEMTQHVFSRGSYLYSHPAPPLLVSHQQNAKTYNGYKLGFAKLAPAPAPAPAFRSVGHQPGQGFIQTHASFVSNNLSHPTLAGSLPPRQIYETVKISPFLYRSVAFRNATERDRKKQKADPDYF